MSVSLHTAIYTDKDGQNTIKDVKDYDDRYMKGRMTCRFCNHGVYARRPKAKITWHYAHMPNQACPFADAKKAQTMTEWHRSYQLACLPEFVEVPMIKNGIGKRVDVYNAKLRQVIELQHSAISENAVTSRENFQLNEMNNKFVWLADATFIGEDFLRCKLQDETGNDVYMIHITGFPWIQYVKTKVILDTIYGWMMIRKDFGKNGFYAVSIIDKESYFVDILRDGVKLPNYTTKELIVPDCGFGFNFESNHFWMREKIANSLMYGIFNKIHYRKNGDFWCFVETESRIILDTEKCKKQLMPAPMLTPAPMPTVFEVVKNPNRRFKGNAQEVGKRLEHFFCHWRFSKDFRLCKYYESEFAKNVSYKTLQNCSSNWEFNYKIRSKPLKSLKIFETLPKDIYEQIGSLRFNMHVEISSDELHSQIRDFQVTATLLDNGGLAIAHVMTGDRQFEQNLVVYRDLKQLITKSESFKTAKPILQNILRSLSSSVYWEYNDRICVMPEENNEQN
jgi:hypothetical protein